jgi:hypothetical protein
MLVRIRTMSRSLCTRLFAAVFLLPLVVLATATSDVGLRCRITGAVLSTCCCGDGDGESAKEAPNATLSQADCCDRVVRDVTPARAELSPAYRALPDQTVPVAVVAFDDSPIDHDPSALSPRSAARASLGPPTVRVRLLAKSAFLI